MQDGSAVFIQLSCYKTHRNVCGRVRKVPCSQHASPHHNPAGTVSYQGPSGQSSRCISAQETGGWSVDLASTVH